MSSRHFRLIAASLFTLLGAASLPALDTVTIASTNPTAYEQGALPGRFTLTRDGSAGSLTVSYTVGGTATATTDYTALTGTVTFAPGSLTSVIDLIPVDDTVVEGAETILVQLTSQPALYTIGATPSAIVTIADSDVALTMSAPDPNGDEFTLLAGVTPSELLRRATLHAGLGQTTASGTTTYDFRGLSRTVSVRIAGTATIGKDYDLAYWEGIGSRTTAAIAAGGTSMTVNNLANLRNQYVRQDVGNYTSLVNSLGVVAAPAARVVPDYVALTNVRGFYLVSGFTAGAATIVSGQATYLDSTLTLASGIIDPASSGIEVKRLTYATVNFPAGGAARGDSSVTLSGGPFSKGDQLTLVGADNVPHGRGRNTILTTTLAAATVSGTGAVTIATADGLSVGDTLYDLSGSVTGAYTVLTKVSATNYTVTPNWNGVAGIGTTVYASRPGGATVYQISDATSAPSYSLAPSLVENCPSGTRVVVNSSAQTFAATVAVALLGGENQVTITGVTLNPNDVLSGFSGTVIGSYTIISSPSTNVYNISPNIDANGGAGTAANTSVTVTRPASVNNTTLVASSSSLTTGVYATGTGTIEYDNPTGGFGIGDAIVIEGTELIYRVASATNTSLTFTKGLANPVSHGTKIFRIGTFINAEGNSALDQGIYTLSIGSGANISDLDYFVFPIDDSTAPVVEGRETVALTAISSPDYQNITPAVATATISDNDSIADITFGSNAGEPNTSGTMVLAFSSSFPNDITIPFQVVNINAAGTAGIATLKTSTSTTSGAVTDGDYSVTGVDDSGIGSVILKAGSKTATITIAPIADTQNEANGETVTVSLLQSPDYLLASSGSSNQNPIATINIADSQGTVKLTTGTPSSGREDPTAPVNPQFTITLFTDDSGTGVPKTPSQPFGVAYTIGGTATAGVDYTVLSGNAVVPASGVVSIPIPILDDILSDPGENVIITLAGGPGYTVSSTANTVAVTILDDEPTVTVAVAVTGGEPATNGRFTVSYPGVPSGTPLNRPVAVAYTVSGTATSGSDYGSLSGTVTIPPGSLQADVDVVVNDDFVRDPGETIIVTLSPSASSLYALAAISAASMTLADDEPLLTIAATTQAAEPATNGLFTISASSAPASALTINYTVSGTATAGTDYATMTGTVVMAASTTTVTVPVTVIDDAVVDPGETVVVTLDGVTGAGSSATVTITDDEPSLLNFSSSTASGTENTSVTITVNRTGGIKGAVQVTLTPTNGTAVSGNDFTFATTSLSWADGESGGKTVSIPLISDGINDPSEAFTITMSNANGATIGTVSTVTVSIVDDGQLNPKLVLTSTDGAEPATAGSFTLTLDPTELTRVVPTNIIYSIGGTATSGSDFVALSGIATIPANVRFVTVPVTVLDDAVVETAETVVLTLPGVGQSATLRISDDEPALVAFTAATAIATEGTPLIIAIVRTAGSKGVLVVDVTTSNGTALAGSDYTALTTTASWADGESGAKNITIPITSDGVTDPGETFTVTLSNVSGGSLGAIATTTVTVNEVGIVPTFTIVATAAAEPATNATFTITATPAPTTALTVAYTVTGSATSGTDFTAPSGSVAFAVAATTATIPIAVIDDAITEGTETVTITLAAPSGATATMNIADDEPSLLGFVSAASTVIEGTTAIVSLQRTNAIKGAVSVVVSSVNGTAVAGGDFTTVSTTVTWNDNETGIKTIAIPIIADGVADPAENFSLTLGTLTGTGVLAGAITTHTISIIESLTVAATNDAKEPATSGVFTVTASTAPASPLNFSYTISGTATSGVDFVALSGSGTIAAGQTTTTIPVDVIDDTATESPETVILTLTGLSGLGSSAGVVITDDEPSYMNFNVAAVTVNEGSLVTVSVVRSGGIKGPASVTVATVAGTATAGSDFTAITTTLFWSDGETGAKNIFVTTISDAVNDPGELFTLSLNSATESSIGLSSSVTVTIDEVVPFPIAIATTNAAEPATNGTFTISVPAVQSSPFSVAYLVSGTATSGADYTPLSGVAVIPAGSSSVTTSLALIDDNLVDVGETVIITLIGNAPAPSATITIVDDEPSLLSFQASGGTALEGTTATFSVVRSGGIKGAAQVAVTSANISALAASDYTAVATTLSWGDGESGAKTFTVPILADAISDPGETFVIVLSNASGGNLGTFAVLTVSIVESATVAVTTQAREPATNGAFTISTPVVLTSNLTIAYTMSGTATSNTDYTSPGGTAVILAGSSSVVVPIVLIDDSLTESTETIVMALNGLSGAGTSDLMTVTDDEPSVISFSVSTAAVNEGATAVLSIVRSGGIKGIAQVTVTSANGTAIAGTDFTALSTTVFWADGTAGTRTVSIPITTDTIFDPSETFTVTLSGVTGASLGTVTTMTVTISESGTTPETPTSTTNNGALNNQNGSSCGAGLGGAGLILSLALMVGLRRRNR